MIKYYEPGSRTGVIEYLKMNSNKQNTLSASLASSSSLREANAPPILSRASRVAPQAASARHLLVMHVLRARKRLFQKRFPQNLAFFSLVCYARSIAVREAGKPAQGLESQ